MTDMIDIEESTEVESTAPLLPEYDKFSWHRVWLIVCYWFPRMKAQLWWYFVGAIFIGVLGGTIDRYLDNFVGAQLVSLTFYFAIVGPATFGIKKGRQFDLSLPARNSEKIVFYLIASLAVFPLFYCLASGLYYLIVGSGIKAKALTIFIEYGIPTDLIESLKKFSWIYNLLCLEGLSMLSLFCAIFIKKNAVLKSVIFSLIAFWIPSFSMGVVAGIEAFKFGYYSAKANIDFVVGQSEIISNVMQGMNMALVWYAIYTLVVFVLFLFLFIKKFPRRQM